MKDCVREVGFCKRVLFVCLACAMRLWAGAVLKFDGGASLAVEGDLTSLGAATTPAPADWTGIELCSTGSLISTVERASIHFADMGIRMSGATAAVRHADFRKNSVGVGGSGGSLTVTDSDLVGNGKGANPAPTRITIDLGDADPDNDGMNRFVCNGIQVEITLGVVTAENNWWGEAPPDPSSFIGAVDYDPFLTTGSNALVPDLVAGLSTDRQDVILEWGDVAPACGYHVMRSTVPDGGFADASGLVPGGDYADLGAGAAPDSYYHLISIDRVRLQRASFAASP